MYLPYCGKYPKLLSTLWNYQCFFHKIIHIVNHLEYFFHISSIEPKDLRGLPQILPQSAKFLPRACSRRSRNIPSLYKVEWDIVGRGKPFSPVSNTCNLCHSFSTHPFGFEQQKGNLFKLQTQTVSPLSPKRKEKEKKTARMKGISRTLVYLFIFLFVLSSC